MCPKPQERAQEGERWPGHVGIARGTVWHAHTKSSGPRDACPVRRGEAPGGCTPRSKGLSSSPGSCVMEGGRGGGQSLDLLSLLPAHPADPSGGTCFSPVTRRAANPSSGSAAVCSERTLISRFLGWPAGWAASQGHRLPGPPWPLHRCHSGFELVVRGGRRMKRGEFLWDHSRGSRRKRWYMCL